LHDNVVVLSHGRADGNDVRVRLEFDDGTTEEEFVEAFRGSAENPMSDDDLVRKLENAAPDDSTAAGVAALPNLLWQLDAADSIEGLIAALTGRLTNAA
jgi:2-methylcitrate dehydratase PrpD